MEEEEDIPAALEAPSTVDIPPAREIAQAYLDKHPDLAARQELMNHFLNLVDELHFGSPALP